MSNLFVLRAESEQNAEQAIQIFKQSQQKNLIQLDDAAIATRQMNGRPQIRELTDLVGTGALGGAFWGLLFGMIFIIPLMETTVGSTTDAIISKFGDIGINDELIKYIGTSIQPGQATIFVLTNQVIPDSIIKALSPHAFEMIQTSLSREDENKIRNALSIQKIEPETPETPE